MEKEGQNRKKVGKLECVLDMKYDKKIKGKNLFKKGDGGVGTFDVGGGALPSLLV